MANVSHQRSILLSANAQDTHVDVLIAGEINSGTAAKLERDLKAIIDSYQPISHFIISLGGVTLINSAGLRVLLVLAKEIRRREGGLAFYEVPPNLLEIFEMTGFDTILSLCDSYATALQVAGIDNTTLNQPKVNNNVVNFH